MRTVDPDQSSRRVNLLPGLLGAAVFAFVAMAGLDFVQSWPAAEHGILTYERACPIYAHPHGKV